MTTDSNATLGQVIRDERARQGFTLAEVGSSADVGRSHICDIEHGRRLPSYEVCIAVLRFLGLPEHEAMRGFIVAPGVIEWAVSRPSLALLLGTLAHFDVSDAELEEMANRAARREAAQP